MEENSSQEKEAKSILMQRVKAIGDAWIVCSSKKHSRMYYFNTLTGKAVWNLSKAELEKAQCNLKQIIEGCPEPLEPPSDLPQPGPSNMAVNPYQRQLINNQFPNNPYPFNRLQCNPFASMNPTVRMPAIPQQMSAPYNPNVWAVPPYPMYGIEDPMFMPQRALFDPMYAANSDGRVFKPTTEIKETNLNSRFGAVMEMGLEKEKKETNDNKSELMLEKSSIMEQDNRYKHGATKNLPVNDLRKVLIAKRKQNNSQEENGTPKKYLNRAHSVEEEITERSEEIEEQMQHLNVTANKMIEANRHEDASLTKKSVPFRYRDENAKETVTFQHKINSNENKSALIQLGRGEENNAVLLENFERQNNDDIPSDDDEEDDELWLLKNTSTQDSEQLIDISVLKKMSDCADSDFWYIAADANVFFCNLPFLKILIQSDQRCRLLVSELVYKEMQASAKQAPDRQSEIRARYACRFIAELLSNGKAVTDRTLLMNHPELSCPIGDDHILNTCVRLADVNYHLILLSNDKLLERKSISSRVHTFTVKHIKNLLSLNNIKRKQNKYTDNSVLLCVSSRNCVSKQNSEQGKYSFQSANLKKIFRTVSVNTQTPANTMIVNAEAQAEIENTSPSVNQNQICYRPTSQSEKTLKQLTLVEKCIQTSSEQPEISRITQNANTLWGFSNATQASGVTKSVQPWKVPSSLNTTQATKTSEPTSRLTGTQRPEINKNMISSNFNRSTKETRPTKFNQTSNASQNIQPSRPAKYTQTLTTARKIEMSDAGKSNETTNPAKNNQSSESTNLIQKSNFDSRTIQFSGAGKSNETSNLVSINQISESAKSVQISNIIRKLPNSEIAKPNQEPNFDITNKLSKLPKITRITHQSTTLKRSQLSRTQAKENPNSARNRLVATGIKKRDIRLKRTSILPTKSPKINDNDKLPFKWRRRKTSGNFTTETTIPTDNTDDTPNESLNATVNATFMNALNSREETQPEFSDPNDYEESLGDQNITQNQSMKSPRIVEESPTTESVISNTRSSVCSDRTLHTLKQVHANLLLENRKKDKVVKTDDKFEVTDPLMEESLKTGCEEWVSRFVQIIEEVLTQILQSNDTFVSAIMPPPWTMHEATQCIMKAFCKQREILEAASQFSFTLCKISDKRGRLRNNLKPKEFMEMFTYGVNLVHSIQLVLRDFEDIRTAIQLLSKLLNDIQDPKYFDNSVTLTENAIDISTDLYNEDTPLLQNRADASQIEGEQLESDEIDAHKNTNNSTQQGVKIVRNLDNIDLVFKNFQKDLKRKKSQAVASENTSEVTKKLVKNVVNKTVVNTSEPKVTRNVIEDKIKAVAQENTGEITKKLAKNVVNKTDVNTSESKVTRNVIEHKIKAVVPENNGENSKKLVKNVVNNTDVNPSEPKVTRNFSVCPEFEDKIKASLDLDALDYNDEDDEYLEDEEYIEDEEYLEDDTNLPDHENNIDNNDLMPIVIETFINEVKDSLKEILMFCQQIRMEVSSKKKISRERRIQMEVQTNHARTYISELLSETLTRILDRETNDPENSVAATLLASRSKNDGFTNNGPLSNYREIVEKYSGEAKKLIAALDFISKKVLPKVEVE